MLQGPPAAAPPHLTLLNPLIPAPVPLPPLSAFRGVPFGFCGSLSGKSVVPFHDRPLSLAGISLVCFAFLQTILSDHHQPLLARLALALHSTLDLRRTILARNETPLPRDFCALRLVLAPTII